MKLIRLGLLLALVACAPALAMAAQLEVTYVEGQLELRQGSVWRALDIGDSLPDTATIQYDGSGVAELEGSGIRLTLHSRGIYQVPDLVAKTRQVASSGLGSIVRGQVVGLFQGAQRTKSAVMGVRASASATEREHVVSWLGSPGDLLAEAKRYLQEQSYEQALATLGEARDAADRLALPEVLYYTAYAEAMMGNGAAALGALSRAGVGPTHPLFGESLILQGQLLVDALSFREAYASFDEYRKHFPTGASAPLADLLAGYCASQTGDREEARRSLERARSVSEASDIGKKAQELLATL